MVIDAEDQENKYHFSGALIELIFKCEDLVSELQVIMKPPLSIYKTVVITSCYEHHHKH